MFIGGPDTNMSAGREIRDESPAPDARSYHGRAHRTRMEPRFHPFCLPHTGAGAV
jgi:hypothetical protein